MFKALVSCLLTLLSLGLISVSAEASRTQVNLGLTVVNPAPAPMVVVAQPQPLMVASAQPMVVMVAPPPPAVAVIMPPQGYSACYQTTGGWMGNVWIPPHQECEYPGPSGMSMWVSGYWGCIAMGPGGGCGRWKWYDHRWRRGGEVAYYGRGGWHHHHRHDW